MAQRVGIVLSVFLVAVAHAVSTNYQSAAATPAPRLSPRDPSWKVDAQDFPENGVPSGAHSFPSYYERAMLTWFNAARTGPVTFRNDYIVPFTTDGSATNILSSYGATMPLPWNLNLNRVARAHGDDRLGCQIPPTDPGALNSCNGSSPSVRLQAYYGSASSFYGPCTFGSHMNPPNAGYSMRYPLAMIGWWLCGGQFGTTGFSLCQSPPAGSAVANLLTTGGEIGIGLAHDMSWSTTLGVMHQGSGNWPEQVYANQPVVSGAHVCTLYTDLTCLFMASYRGTTTPDAKVYVNGVGTVMTALSTMPSSPVGTYRADLSFRSTDACKSYYFVIGNYRYPEKGIFRTFGLGTCNEDWIPCSCSTAGPCCDGCLETNNGSPCSEGGGHGTCYSGQCMLATSSSAHSPSPGPSPVPSPSPDPSPMPSPFVSSSPGPLPSPSPFVSSTPGPLPSVPGSSSPSFDSYAPPSSAPEPHVSSQPAPDPSHSGPDPSGSDTPKPSSHVTKSSAVPSGGHTSPVDSDTDSAEHAVLSVVVLVGMSAFATL